MRTPIADKRPPLVYGVGAVASGAAPGSPLIYRMSVTLLLLAALKRLADIARRRAEGLDLRHVEEMLREKEVDAQDMAIGQLRVFALRGRQNAQLVLERVLVPTKSDDWSLGPGVRLQAADALREAVKEISEVSYLFARPSDPTPVAKVSFVTRVGDIYCGVGYYKK